MYTIIAYASIIIGAFVLFFIRMEPKNRIIRSILKLLISVAFPVALIFGYLASEDSFSVFMRTVITIFETLIVGTLCFSITHPRDSYDFIFDAVKNEFVFSDLWKHWESWVGHVVIACTFVIFLFWLVFASITLSQTYGNVAFATALTFLSVIIIAIFILLVSTLYNLASNWIKWLIK